MKQKKINDSAGVTEEEVDKPDYKTNRDRAKPGTTHRTGSSKKERFQCKVVKEGNSGDERNGIKA